MSSPEEGGTKIRRNSPPPEMPPPPPQMQSSPQVDPREDMMQQQMMQQQMMQQPPQGYQAPPVQQNSMGSPSRSILKKSTFGGKSSFYGAFDSPIFKYTLLVIIIFMILNSKFIWKQIMHFPLMGSAEPSVVALVVNSVIAGMAFYIISSFLIKN